MIADTHDLALVFDAFPGAVALFAADAPDFTVVAASDRLVATAGRPRERVVGLPLAAVFPSNGGDAGDGGLASLRASLEAAIRTGEPQRMARQRYDLELPDGRWDERYWDALNTPIRGADGGIRFVLHQTEDVTDRVRDLAARRKVEEENSFLAAVVQATGEAMFGVTLDGVIRSWNPAAERLLGYAADEIVGRHVSVLAAPEQREAQRAIIAEIGRGRTVSRETTRLAKGGHPVDVILTTGPVMDAAGTPVGISAVLVDIRERKRAEAALQLERARLLDVFRQAPVAAVVLRGRVAAELVFELVNPRYEEMIPAGRAPLGRRLGDALPEVLESVGAILQRVLDTGVPFVAHEYPVPLDRDGDGVPEECFFNFVYHPLVEAEHEVDGIIGVAVEVTDSVRARRDAEHARERAERLQALTAALAGARTLDDVADVVVADMVVALGARTGALAGRAPEGDALVLLRTVGFPETVPPHVRRQPLDFRSPLIECFRTQAPVWLETREGPEGVDHRFPAIAPVWDLLGVAAAAFVPLVVAGETIGAISFAFEAPRRFGEAEREFLLALGQQAALALERARLFDAEHAARAEAERANRAKSEFLAVMSHELRTPLNAIGGYAELLEMGIRGPVTPQQREDLRRVQTSQRHLLGLINEVLNYAKLETGTVHFDVADVRLREALGAAEALVAPQAQAKQLALTLHAVPPGLVVRADAEKLRQVVVNLLSNAIKFTDRGGRVDVETEPAGEVVRIHVRDTGIGIARDQLERIFEPFVQVRADLTRTSEGTGLGLAISRDLARGMGGDLTATSAVGVGSTFTITLPAGAKGD